MLLGLAPPSGLVREVSGCLDKWRTQLTHKSSDYIASLTID